MTVHNLGELDKFLKKNKTAEAELSAWLAVVQNKRWLSIEDLETDWRNIRDVFPNSIPARIVFKIRFSWRIDTKIDFVSGIVFILRVGTHETYNKWKYEP